MRVDVAESLEALDEANSPPVEEAGAERALKSFFAAIESDDSLFACEARGPRLANAASGGESGAAACSGDFVLRFRDASLDSSRRLYFALVEKLVELLKVAGSAESLAARMCLSADSGAEMKPGGLALRLRLEATGSSPEQASLRWGLGVAHVQQAVLFTSRYLRQQIGQSAH
jgi:hypothetical protein